MKKGYKRKLLLIGLSIVITMAVALLVIGLLSYLEYQKVVNNPNPTIPKEVVTRSVDTPDETPLDDECQNYKVAANQPRVISIPRIDVSGCIQRVGVDENNAIAVPTNIHLAGWYTASAVPGQKGVSIIDGHVLGQYGDAIFSQLDQLRENDIISIEFGDSSKKSFQVVTSAVYSAEDTPKHMFDRLEGVDTQLTLITCSGKYIRDQETYDSRLIVRTKLVETRSSRV